MLIVLELLIIWFMLGIKVGSWVIGKIGDFFIWLIVCVSDGIVFVFLLVMVNEIVDFFFSVFFLIIFIVIFFDILIYFGILFWLIDKIGWVILKVFCLLKLESFFFI